MKLGEAHSVGYRAEQYGAMSCATISKTGNREIEALWQNASSETERVMPQSERMQ